MANTIHSRNTFPINKRQSKVEQLRLGPQALIEAENQVTTLLNKERAWEQEVANLRKELQELKDQLNQGGNLEHGELLEVVVGPDAVLVDVDLPGPDEDLEAFDDIEVEVEVEMDEEVEVIAEQPPTENDTNTNQQ